jgi:NitT/TauT family transport system substrate-binding protein
VESKTFSAGADTLASFASGNLTAQAATNPEVVAQTARGVDYRIIMMADSSLGGDGILARNSVKDIADFKGRKVGVDIGGTGYYFLLQVLKEKGGLSVEDIEPVNVPADAAAAAYQAGTIDIAVTYEPFLSLTGKEQPDGRVIIDTSDMPTAILDVYIFQADFVEKNPEQVQAFVNGIFKAIAFIESDSEEAYKIIGEKLEITPEEVKEQLGGVDLTSLEDNQKVLTGEGATQSMAQNLITLSEFLMEQKEIEAPLTPEQTSKLIDASFVKAATVAK